MKKNTLYSILATLFLAVVAILFFFPEDFDGKVLQQADIQQGIANGQEGKLFTEQTGETTRWTNSLFSGMPNFQISPSYAASGFLGWIAKLYTLWLPSPANILFAMMIGFFIMCLCMKFKWWNALLGALAWGFSTYFIILIGAGHIWKFVTLAYIPPTIGGIALCYRGKYLGGTALTALFAALQLQSNHPQMSYYFAFVIVAMVIAWLVDAIRNKTLKTWGIATACVFAGALIAFGANATGLYNSYEYSKETIRGKATDLVDEGQGAKSQGLDKNYITAWSYGIDETFTLMIPNVKGGATIKPVAGQNELKSIADTSTIENSSLSGPELQFVAQFPQYFGDQPMTNGPVYVGVFIFLLAILAMFVCEGSMKWALFAVSILAIILSWGHNFMAPTDFFIDHFPLYNKFRTVSSILVIVEFTIPLLAIMCISKIVTTPDFFEKFSMQFYVVFGLGAFICLIGAISPSIFGGAFSAQEMEQLQSAGAFSDPQYAGILNAVQSARRGLVSADCWRSLIFILLAFGVMMLYFKKAYTQPAVMVGSLAVLMVIDLFSVNKRYVDAENFTDPVDNDIVFRKTAADEEILKDKSNYRVFDIDGFSSPRSSYFHKTIGGYHAAKLTRYNDLIDNQISKGNEGVLNMLNTKYIISCDSVVTNPYALGNAWFVSDITYVDTPNQEMAALDTLDTGNAAVADKKFSDILGKAVAKVPGDTIIETSYAPNALSYKSHSSRDNIAVFSEVFFPWGWQAEIDGKPVEIGRVNYVLRAIRIPAGDHQITMRFDPQSVEKAETWSTISCIIIYILLLSAGGLCVVRILKSRKEK